MGAVRSRLVVAVSVVLVVSLGAGTAVAVPPPPPNPSDDQITGSKAKAHTQASRVGRLTNEVAQAEAQLVQLQSDVELEMEIANKALVDLQTARADARQAKTDADAAKAVADSAERTIVDKRTALDEFAAGSYKQHSTIGSVSAYLGARSPKDLLDRAALLNAVSGSELDALDSLQLARTDKANKDSLARAALAVANQKRDRARAAKVAADTAKAAAEQAQLDGIAAAKQAQSRKASAEAQLSAAQSAVTGLENQRQRYDAWLAAKRREDAQLAHGGGTVDLPPRGSARAVINRALSQLGVPYAWGGGGAYGPTLGIHDGGIADLYGDYHKIGFDCSGLMVYAFAAAGYRLPHYSGYQAVAGRRVPLSRKAPGDLLFWATGGNIHHVALYIGNEQMIEAPYSGSFVRIASVRYGGIVPYATRLL